jgi:ectoine hydroxylase-related dioxygenase (phytanoyl-CoA dioxygenase family)
MTAAPLRAISASEIEAFHRDGAVMLSGVLAAEWVDLVADGTEAALAAPDSMSSDMAAMRVDQFPAAKSSELARIITDSPIAEIVGRVLNSPVRFYMDQMFYKPAGLIASTAWHQDTCYYNIEGHDVVRAWVSPDRVPRNLSLEVVRGSHRWNATYMPLAGRDASTSRSAREMLDNARDDTPMLSADSYKDWNYWRGVQDPTLPLVPDIDAHRDSFDIIGWDYSPGDVILFHGNILHSALGDRESPNPRRAHASLWAGDDVRYHHRVGQMIPDPRALYDHSPATGQPLSDFPDVFPVRWSPQA